MPTGEAELLLSVNGSVTGARCTITGKKVSSNGESWITELNSPWPENWTCPPPTVRMALRDPSITGLNCTAMPQLPWGGRDPTQVFPLITISGSPTSEGAGGVPALSEVLVTVTILGMATPLIC